MNSCPNSSIFDLCKFRDWRRVELECKREPINAQYVGDDDESLPIHIACKKQPTVRIIRALLKAYPQGARTRDAHGYLPIHVACLSNASIETLRVLADNDPETATMLTSTGESAITILSLTRDTTESIVDFSNLALWQSGTSELKEVNFTTLYWQKILLFIESIAIHRQSGKLQCVDDFFILHAAISISWCPAEVLYYCCNQYPDQIRTCDDLGRLPLHIAVGRTAHYRSTEAFVSKLQLQEKSIVLPGLLHYYPEAAKCIDPTEPKGRYPLHTALVNKHEWHGGIKELVHRFPDAAIQLDPVEKLYPFQLATHDLDTTYQILRKAPSVLLHFVTKRHTAKAKTSCMKQSYHLSNKSSSYLKASTGSIKASLHSTSKSSQGTNLQRKKFVVPSFHEDKTGDVSMKPRSTINPLSEDGITEVVWTPSFVNTFCIDTISPNKSAICQQEVIWQPPSYEARKMDKVHSIKEIIISPKSGRSKRRNTKRSISKLPIDNSSHHQLLQPVNTNVEGNLDALTENKSDGKYIVSLPERLMDDIYQDTKCSMHSSVTPLTECLSSDQQSSSSEPVNDDSCSSSSDGINNDDHELVHVNNNVDGKSSCFEEINDEIEPTNYRVYNKYKCLISGRDKENEFNHGWNQDVVKSNVRKLYKQPTREILEC